MNINAVKGTGSSVATTSTADLTWLVLSSNSSDITGTGLTVVMTITGLPIGRYNFTCMLIYQTTNTGTGIDTAVNFTGTATQYLVEARYASTGAGAATGVATEAANAATGNLYEAQGMRTNNTAIGAGTTGVDATNSDMLMTIEGFIVVSVTGNLEIKLAADGVGEVCRAMQGSTLELRRFS